MSWGLARAYARTYGAVKDRWDVNLPGLGWVLRRVREPREFELAGQRMLFDPRVAGCYDRMIAGQFNERETWLFIQQALDRVKFRVTFVEVGANVGEFLIPVAGHPKVNRVIGYEPHPVCAEVCVRNAQVNHLINVEVRTALVGDGRYHPFSINSRNANASSIGSGGALRPTVRLDDELRDVHAPTILLIDVEGAEPLVLRGAAEFIARAQPLIIFEYNYVSRRHFTLSDVRALLGDHYDVWRLRRDGRLDRDVENSWNCVAIARDSEFERLKPVR